MSGEPDMLQPMDAGDTKAADELLALVYDELRHLAARKLAQEAPGQTLQATALVHEAWLKLVSVGDRRFQNRGHFFGAAAEAMRRILIDRARRRLTRRHGGDLQRVEWVEDSLVAPVADEELMAIDEALDKLERAHPQQAEVVKLRYFAGLKNEEIAQLLGLSVSTVKNYWTFARAWLFAELRRT